MCFFVSYHLPSLLSKPYNVKKKFCESRGRGKQGKAGEKGKGRYGLSLLHPREE